MSGTIRKQYMSEIGKAPGRAGRVRRFTISTPSVDRDNDTIEPSGWKLENYKQNPVVLWAHDYSQLPIARAVDIRIEGTKLVADAEFADHDFANTVLRLIDGKFLRATSVGFRPTKVVPNTQRGGYDFKEQELLEFSIVPVPANPEALSRMKAAGITVWSADNGIALEFDDADDIALELHDAADLRARYPEYPEFFAAGDVALELADDSIADVRRHVANIARAATVAGLRRGFAADPTADPAERQHVRDLMRSAIRESLAEVTGQAVREAIARVRGRVD